MLFQVIEEALAAKHILKIMNIKATLVLVFVLLVTGQAGRAQSFVNLNFENAVIVYDPSGLYPDSCYASLAVPGWTACINAAPQADTIHNDVSLGAAEVSIHDQNDPFGYLPIAGNYSIMLQGEYNPDNSSGFMDSASIGQVGTIPANTQSFVFWGFNVVNLQITFNGQSLAYNAVGSGSGYVIYDGDISGYAGQTGELLFTAPDNGAAMLDNIQFSTNAIPEPNVLALSTLGTVLLGLSRRKRLRIKKLLQPWPCESTQRTA